MLLLICIIEASVLLENELDLEKSRFGLPCLQQTKLKTLSSSCWNFLKTQAKINKCR